MVMCAVKPDLWAGVVKYEASSCCSSWLMELFRSALRGVCSPCRLLCLYSVLCRRLPLVATLLCSLLVLVLLFMLVVLVPFGTLTQLLLRLLCRPRRRCL